MQHPDLDKIRQLYNFACGYCHTSEIAAGGELTLDHFQPRSAGGGDEFDNQVYACFRCNLNKHDFWPTEQDLAAGHRILHPLRDDASQHITFNQQTGRLEPLTETGRFHINLLRLNRSQLIRSRITLQFEELLKEKHLLLAQQVNELERTLNAQQRYIEILTEQIKSVK